MEIVNLKELLVVGNSTDCCTISYKLDASLGLMTIESELLKKFEADIEPVDEERLHLLKSQMKSQKLFGRKIIMEHIYENYEILLNQSISGIKYSTFHGKGIPVWELLKLIKPVTKYAKDMISDGADNIHEECKEKFLQLLTKIKELKQYLRKTKEIYNRYISTTHLELTTDHMIKLWLTAEDEPLPDSGPAVIVVRSSDDKRRKRRRKEKIDMLNLNVEKLDGYDDIIKKALDLNRLIMRRSRVDLKRKIKQITKSLITNAYYVQMPANYEETIEAVVRNDSVSTITNNLLLPTCEEGMRNTASGVIRIVNNSGFENDTAATQTNEAADNKSNTNDEINRSEITGVRNVDESSYSDPYQKYEQLILDEARHEPPISLVQYENGAPINLPKKTRVSNYDRLKMDEFFDSFDENIPNVKKLQQQPEVEEQQRQQDQPPLFTYRILDANEAAAAAATNDETDEVTMSNYERLKMDELFDSLDINIKKGNEDSESSHDLSVVTPTSVTPAVVTPPAKLPSIYWRKKGPKKARVPKTDMEFTDRDICVKWICKNIKMCPDKQFAVRREALYNLYVDDCEASDRDKINVASFGKCIEKVFRHIRSRRLLFRDTILKYHYIGIMPKGLHYTACENRRL